MNRPRLRGRRQLLGLGVATLAVLLAAWGLIGWLTKRPHLEQSTAGTTTTTAGAASSPARPIPSSAEAQAQLFKLLPAGYPAGACSPATPLAGAVAALSCGANTDLRGPSSATYTLFPHDGPLHLSFDTMVQSSTVVNCPGRIQSPGPWHHAATPNKASGLLLCSVHQNRPTVVWTNDADLVVNVIKADRNGPSLDQLYAWWSSHS